MMVKQNKKTSKAKDSKERSTASKNTANKLDSEDEIDHEHRPMTKKQQKRDNDSDTQKIRKSRDNSRCYGSEDEEDQEALARLQEFVEGIFDKKLKPITESYKEQKVAMNSMKMELTDVKAENAKLKKMIERLQFQLGKKEDDIEHLEAKIDDLAQKELEKNVRIIGLTENDHDIEDVQKIAKEYKLKLKKADIVETIRLGSNSRKKKCRDLIVKFREKSVREDFYNCRKTNRDKEILKGVYTNEHLTERRSSLFYTGRQMVKHKKIQAAWSQSGNILIRKDDKSKPIHIRTHHQLREINLEVDSDNDSISGLSRYSMSIISD